MGPILSVRETGVVAAAPTPEVLTREARSRGPLVLALVVLLVVGAAAAWVVDQHRRHTEATQIAACARAAAQAVDDAEASLGTFYSYIAPAVDPERSRASHHLYVYLSRAAPRLVPPVRGALARCDGIRVWHRHEDLRAARSAYVVLLRAELDRLVRVSQDGTAYVGGSNEIQVLRSAAQRLQP
jgi:hypothetical protein